MTKRDLRKELGYLYNPSRKDASIVDVPSMGFLMIDGSGDPNTSQDYQDALQVLYSLSFTLKFMVKKQQGIDYTVMALEGLWWMNEMGNRFGELDFTADKNRWSWTMMMMQPDFITAEWVQQACAEVARKSNPPALAKVRFESFAEGKAAQIMHIGPYSAEKPTIEKLHHFIAEQGYVPVGKHHEIYLGDPRRAAPDKLKTIIRQPIAKKTP